jgi:DNA polymerase/3'-5' exonuclease PolX
MADLNLFGVTKKIEDKIRAAGITTKTQLLRSPIYNDLPKSTKIHLTYNISAGMPTSVLNHFRDELNAEAKKLHFSRGNSFIAVGSISRGAAVHSDVDFLTLISINNSTEVVKSLGYYIDDYSTGAAKTTIVVKYSGVIFTVDLFYTARENLVFAKFHYIGSKAFNIRSRRLAKLLGYKLNQYGLFKNGKKINVANERELFAIINITYKRPADRIE